LYGNLQALEELNRMAAREGALLALNGDMHWFDSTPEDFLAVEEKSRDHIKLNGNVEMELCRTNDIGAGCGCAYPEYVADDIVSRSNRIHQKLKTAMEQLPSWKGVLAQRPSVAVFSVDRHRVAVTHGDERSLGGWNCSGGALSRPDRQNSLFSWLEKMNLEVMATAHTCAPAALAQRGRTVINNGAAGMPNFSGRLFGLATRIADTQNKNALYRMSWRNLYVEALPILYHHEAFLEWFDGIWPGESPAEQSYRDRIVSGPAFSINEALLGGFSLNMHQT